MPDYSLSRLYTEDEVAEIIKVSAKTIAKQRRAGFLEHVRVSNRCIRILGRHIDEFIKRRAVSVAVDDSKESTRGTCALATRACADDALLRAYELCANEQVELPAKMSRTPKG